MASDPDEDLSNRMNSVSLCEDIGDEGIDMENPMQGEDLPSVLIVTSVADGVFDNEETKRYFEGLFQGFDADATFQYLKSFRRARVNFSTPMRAVRARIQLNETLIDGKKIKCYFAQGCYQLCRVDMNDITMCILCTNCPTCVNWNYAIKPMKPAFQGGASGSSGICSVCMFQAREQWISALKHKPLNAGMDPQSRHLHPPKPDKQFLISPPASPPVGWEPVHEAQPIINYDLLSAIANLTPGEAHEIHPQSDNQPGIVVHICEEPNGLRIAEKQKIQQTKRPDIK